MPTSYNMNFPRNIINLSLDSQMQLSTASKANHREEVANCMPIGNMYRDVASTSDANPCLPRGIVDNPYNPLCCRYANGEPFFVLLLEIFTTTFAGMQNDNPRLMRLHNWLIRKFRYPRTIPMLLLDDLRYPYICEWLQLLAPQRTRMILPNEIARRTLNVVLPHGPLNAATRVNVEHFVYNYMVPQSSVQVRNEGRFRDHAMLKHVCRYALQTDVGQHIFIAVNRSSTFLSECLDYLLASPLDLLITNNQFLLAPIDNVNGLNINMALRDVTGRLNTWIALHENDHVGHGSFVFRFTFAFLRNRRNSDWNRTHAAIRGFEYQVQDDQRIWFKTMMHYEVRIIYEPNVQTITILILGNQ